MAKKAAEGKRLGRGLAALIGDMDVNQSLNQAKSIWQDRDKQPFSILFS